MLHEAERSTHQRAIAESSPSPPLALEPEPLLLRHREDDRHWIDFDGKQGCLLKLRAFVTRMGPTSTTIFLAR